jgi:predicted acylesterase/phospholipase RssA
MPQRYLLSIDGGGIRGIIPAVALTRLEHTTGRLTRDIFSFVAGTSTGAIIAAAVAAGIPAPRILDLYVNRVREVFTGFPPLNTLKRITFGSMYSTQKLHDLISEELGPAKSSGPNMCSQRSRAVSGARNARPSSRRNQHRRGALAQPSDLCE